MDFARRQIHFWGRKLLGGADNLRRIAAFALISFGVALTKSKVARGVVRPQLRLILYQTGVKMLPMISLFALVLGLLIVGQSVFLLNRVGARDLIGTVMVGIVFRELGPLLTAILVLMRSGTSTVIELGTARAMGEVEGLESMAIDPIHYLVVPRVLAMAISLFCLTVYLVLGTLFSGYLFVFLQDIPLLPGEYLGQLAGALNWLDFVVMGLKTLCFGALIAIVVCYHGLARPLHLEEVSGVTLKAVGQGVAGCLLIDAIFLTVYLAL